MAKKHPKKKKDKGRHKLISMTIGKIQSVEGKARYRKEQERRQKGGDEAW